MILTFDSVDQNFWCDSSNETSSTILSHGSLHLVCSTNFRVCGWNPIVWPFKWNLFKSFFHILLCIVLTFESVDAILWCYHSNETSSEILSHGTIYLVCSSKEIESVDAILWCYLSNETSSAVLSHGTNCLVSSSNFRDCGWNPMELPFKRILFSSTSTRYFLFFSILQNVIAEFCCVLTLGTSGIEMVNKTVNILTVTWRKWSSKQNVRGG